MNSPRKILRAKAVQDATGYSRVQIWRKSRDPNDAFPAPVQLGPPGGAIGWYEDLIVAWLESRPRVNWASVVIFAIGLAGLALLGWDAEAAAKAEALTNEAAASDPAEAG